MVLTAYQGHCCVSGNLLAELLVASHIPPWASHPEQGVVVTLDAEHQFHALLS
jgi:hypothetical protein